MKLFSAIALAIAFSTSAAMAQGGAVTKDKKVTTVPTSAECIRGWNSAMPWKKAEFDKACAKVQSTKK